MNCCCIILSYLLFNVICDCCNDNGGSGCCHGVMLRDNLFVLCDEYSCCRYGFASNKRCICGLFDLRGRRQIRNRHTRAADGCALCSGGEVKDCEDGLVSEELIVPVQINKIALGGLGDTIVGWNRENLSMYRLLSSLFLILVG